MKLKKLVFKNFKSYSNVLTEIQFDKKYSLNLIVGENGTGKTSIAECATYLLYGKLENFTASDIPNRINKSFYGKIELDCDGHLVIIERGLNPSLFKVEIDGETIDTAGKSNVQTMLEENYFKIPYSVFHNILVLEVGEVKSLLSMNVADKRNIIDKICGFTTYNLYNRFVKDDLKIIGEHLSSNLGSIRSVNTSLNQYDKQIEEIKENEISQEELNNLEQEINKAKKVKKEIDEMSNKIINAREQLKGVKIQKIGEFNNLKEKILEVDKKIHLIESGKCPTCGSSLETEEFQKEKENLIELKKGYALQMKQIKELVDTVQSRIITLNTKENEIRKSGNNSNLLDLQADFKYKQTLKEKNTVSIENLKNGLISQLDEMNKEKKQLEAEKDVLDYILSIMGEGKDGIKRYISNTYIPIINSLIVDMLNYMNLNYSITFDSNFDATIRQNGMNVKYCTLSKGEKRRVDFATVIAFIRFLKIQFAELNLLFLDEIFSNVDINGVSDMIDILKDLCKDMNLNIYLIHHAKLEGVMFDKVIHTTKVDGFSKIEYI